MKKTKYKYDPTTIWQCDKYFTKKDGWLKIRTKDKDQKCANCNKLFIDDSSEYIGLATIKGSPNIAICSECSDLFIKNGAVDIQQVRLNNDDLKRNLMDNILTISDKLNLGYKEEIKSEWYKHKELKSKNLEELNKIDKEVTKLYEDYLQVQKEIEENYVDTPLEQYLIDDYGFSQFKDVKHTSHIEDHYKDCGQELFDCGADEYEDEVTTFLKIGNKYYQVTIEAEINSTKNIEGCYRYYWVEKVSKVSWIEIDKPLPKEEHKYILEFNLNKDKFEYLKQFLTEHNYQYETRDN